MKAAIEVRCIECHLVFCCSDCRWKHEQTAHGLTYECPLCRGSNYLCRPQLLNQDFIEHLTSEHLPLRCKKCRKLFQKMEDFLDIEKCTSISELIATDVEIRKEMNVEEKFDSIYEKINNEGDNFEAIVSVNKSSKTAVITPIVRKNHLVDYDSSDGDNSDESFKADVGTPHPKQVPKTPKLKKRQRMATPHAKKLMGLVRQKVIEEYDETADDIMYEAPTNPKTPTPSRNDNLGNKEQEMTTPTSHLCAAHAARAGVSTSTPTPGAAAWGLFPGPGNDSPLSEIENGESPAQSLDKEPSKFDEMVPKLKGIISSRLSTQDSSEKHVTFQDSNTDSSLKIKKVKFADDTIFNREPAIKRVYRKPKRMLTPGPQRPKFKSNPRFQALINRFENRIATLSQTPLNIPQKSHDTPAVEHNVLARAISFKDSPGLETSRDTNELFSTCVEPNNAITALTTNIAGSLQTCLTSLLRTNDEETEIQFKFVITKKKVSVKRMADGGDEELSEIDRDVASEKENIWSSVTKAVKKVFWGEKETPHRSTSSDSSLSASKRKYEDLSDSESPLNHKRHKYQGRIRGRPPLRAQCGVSSLRSTLSAEQHSMIQQLNQDLTNQSF